MFPWSLSLCEESRELSGSGLSRVISNHGGATSPASCLFAVSLGARHLCEQPGRSCWEVALRGSHRLLVPKAPTTSFYPFALNKKTPLQGAPQRDHAMRALTRWPCSVSP